MVKPKELAALEKRLGQVSRKLDRLVQGMSWFLDPEPTDRPTARDNGRPKRPKAKDRRLDFGDGERLRVLRPKAYELGRDTFLQGLPKSTNPYKDTRGGYRNAWFHGWQDAHDEQAQEQANAE